MGLNEYDKKQIEYVANLLESCGIEPTIDTLQALAETAKSSFPNDAEGLQKAAEIMVSFFATPSDYSNRQELTWNRFKRWVVSVLRIKVVGILPNRDGG